MLIHWKENAEGSLTIIKGSHYLNTQSARAPERLKTSLSIILKPFYFFEILDHCRLIFFQFDLYASIYGSLLKTNFHRVALRK